MPLEILHEDAHLIAVSKPAGLLTQGRLGGEATLETQVRRRLYPEDSAGGYLGTIHRLDRPVSGVVLWARTPKASRRVAEQFAVREVAKLYWCVVSGLPDAARGEWEDWLLEGDGPVRVVAPQSPGARRAVTRFERGEAEGLAAGDAFLRLHPQTGRTHQLRVQAGSRGFPILGDAAYGSARGFPLGIALHARSLTIRHPVLGTRLTIVAPQPACWIEAGITCR